MLGAATGARAAVYDYTGGLQTYTAPVTGTYDITAWGAQGGDFQTGCRASGGCLLYNAGGLGAKIGGDVSLKAGETLTLLVGGQGKRHGGGGGSFVVVTASNMALVVAGGGGGALATAAAAAG